MSEKNELPQVDPDALIAIIEDAVQRILEGYVNRTREHDLVDIEYVRQYIVACGGVYSAIERLRERNLSMKVTRQVIETFTGMNA